MPLLACLFPQPHNAATEQKRQHRHKAGRAAGVCRIDGKHLMHPATHHPATKRAVDTGMTRRHMDRKWALTINRSLMLHMTTKGADDSGKFVHFMFLSLHCFASQSGESLSSRIQRSNTMR